MQVNIDEIQGTLNDQNNISADSNDIIGYATTSGSTGRPKVMEFKYQKPENEFPYWENDPKSSAGLGSLAPSSGAIFILSSSIRILNSQCLEGARDVRVLSLTPVN